MKPINTKLRSINTKFWDDPYIVDLKPIEKLIFLYLLTNSLNVLAGCYEISANKISFDTGINKEEVDAILEKFGKDDKIRYLDGYIILKNFLKHQAFNNNMIKNVEATFKILPTNIKKAFKGFVKPSEGFESLWELEEKEENEFEGEAESKFEQKKEKKNRIVNPKEKTKDNHKEGSEGLSLTQNMWNSFAKENGLGTILSLTDKRKSGIRARLKESAFDLTKIFEEIKNSSFLKGKNDRGWKVDFDFIFLSPNNYIKILEGKYSDAGRNNKGATAEELAQIATERYIRNNG